MLKRSLLPIMIAVLVALTGCAGNREYLAVRKNMEVDNIFRSGQMLPDFRYYYNGPDSEPVALLALDREYVLRSEFWHEFTSEEMLGKWLREFAQLNGTYDDLKYLTIYYEGYQLLDEAKRPVGMVYTKYDWVVAWWGEGETVIVTQPEPSGMNGSLFRPGRFSR